MRKRFLFIFAAPAVVFCMAGCRSNDVDTGKVEQTSREGKQVTVVEQTNNETAQIIVDEDEFDDEDEEPAAIEDLSYEILAEGQERDWKIEDVLKNDLEIDGIPVSIPCTVEELLNALGDEYNIDEEVIFYNGEETFLSISTFPDNENIVCGLFFTNLFDEKGILGFRNINDSFDKFLEKYTLPNETEKENTKVKIRYKDEDCYMNCVYRGNCFTTIFIGYSTGDEN